MSLHTEEELERIRRLAVEDTRSDEEVRARALAKARGELYDPKKHGPFEPVKPPRQQRESKPEPIAPDVDALLERFRSRAPRRLQVVKDRPDTEWINR